MGDFAKDIASDIKSKLDTFKENPKLGKLFLEKAGEGVSAFIDKPASTLAQMGKTMGKALGNLVLTGIKAGIEKAEPGITEKIKTRITDNVITPLKQKYEALVPEKYRPTLSLNADEKAFMSESFQPGIDSAKEAIRTDIKDHIEADIKADMEHSIETGKAPEKP